MRSLKAHAINLPANAGRADRAGVEGQAKIIFGVQTMAGCHALQDFSTVLGPEAEGTQAGFVTTIGPDQAQDAKVFFGDELGRRHQCTVDLPPFLGAFRILPLADFNGELTAISGPFQNVEELLPGAGRPGLFLGDCHRNPAQIVKPGQGATTDLLLGISVFNRFEQHRGDMLAMLSDRAGTTADHRHFTALRLA